MTAGNGKMGPTVTVAIPVLNEEEQLERCLSAVDAQRYPHIVEVLVADGGSADRTREIAAAHPRVRVLDNPRRIRPAGLNVALEAAKGEVFVRVDARTAIDPGYVEGCVAALAGTGAAIVGGPMRLAAGTARQRGVRTAMMSRIGGGPAKFRRVPAEPCFVDTVYLGAFHTDVLRELGGYDERFGGAEDAELAYRAQRAGGVYMDPGIVSHYLVRAGIVSLARQYYRYGRARAGTVRKHPSSVAPRQLAVPLLFIGLASPWRLYVLAAYGAVVLGRALAEVPGDPAAAGVVAAALPTMHGAWGVGFYRGLLLPRRRTDLRGSVR